MPKVMNSNHADLENFSAMQTALEKVFNQVPEQHRHEVKSVTITKYINRDGRLIAAARANVSMRFFANSYDESEAVRY